MPNPGHSNEALEATAKAYNDFKGDAKAAAASLGVLPATFHTRLHRIRATHPQLLKSWDKPTGGQPPLAVELLRDASAAFDKCGSISKAAEYLGIPRGTMENRLREARRRSDEITPTGRVESLKPIKLPRPKKGKVKRYLLSCAQNCTHVEPATWAAGLALAKAYDAEIKISRFRYIHKMDGAAKSDTEQDTSGDWYDPRIEPYVSDRCEELGKSLVWNGHFQISPTAVTPLTGLESYNGRSSGIFPHPAFAMESVASINHGQAKFNYTTGCITLRNYIQRKAGLKAEFHHVYGFLLVEVDDTGQWFAREVHGSDNGIICDLDVVARSDGRVERMDVANKTNPAAITWGDIHESNMNPEVRKLGWGPGGKSVIDVLKPARQYFHDILDFERRSHHNRKDPFALFHHHVTGQESIADECKGVGLFLDYSSRPFCKSFVVSSNHDRHLDRYIKEADWRNDLVNAEFYASALSAILKSIRSGTGLNTLQWAVGWLHPVSGVKWLKQGESSLVLGIECGLHGDQGPNGARGSAQNLARMGRKANIGHSHSARAVQGVRQAGTSGNLSPEYVKGSPSSWSAMHIITHHTGKRQFLHMRNGKWCADRREIYRRLA